MSEDESAGGNRNPAIERMMVILDEIARRPGGLGLKRIAESTGVTRSTAYRILNSLAAHDMVRQAGDTHYVLGPRLLTLAAGVTEAALGAGVAHEAQPHVDRLSAAFGETCKVSVYDRGFVIVVAVCLGRKVRALQSQVGEYMPIHAGGASKVLLAHLPQDELEKLLTRRLIRFTDQTLTNPVALRDELARVREQGWARDHGEFDISVNSYAAPIRAPDGRVMAALSLPFLSRETVEFETAVRMAVIETATRISETLAR